MQRKAAKKASANAPPRVLRAVREWLRLEGLPKFSAVIDAPALAVDGDDEGKFFHFHLVHGFAQKVGEGDALRALDGVPVGGARAADVVKLDGIIAAQCRAHLFAHLALADHAGKPEV